MPGKVWSTIRTAEDGLTIVELLVVMLLIGALSAVAIPAFGNEMDVGDDTTAQMSARNVLDQVEDCVSYWRAFPVCDESRELELDDVQFGSGPGHVTVSATTDRVEIRAISEATGGGANHVFTLTEDSEKNVTRTCGPVEVRGRGGCPSNGRW